MAGQRVAVAVKRAFEWMHFGGIAAALINACHRCHADVSGQFDELAVVLPAIAYTVGKAVPFLGTADDVGVSLCAVARGCPSFIVEDDRDGGVATRHVEPIVGFIRTIIRDIVAVGIGDGDAHSRARGHLQRDFSIGISLRCAGLTGNHGPNGSNTIGVDGDTVRIHKGVAENIFAIGSIVLALIKGVETILLRVLPAHIFIAIRIIIWVIEQRAVEHAVLDGAV